MKIIVSDGSTPDVTFVLDGSDLPDGIDTLEPLEPVAIDGEAGAFSVELRVTGTATDLINVFANLKAEAGTPAGTHVTRVYIKPAPETPPNGEEGPQPPEPATVLLDLNEAERVSQLVTFLQVHLNEIRNAGLAVTGEFDTATRDALQALQTDAESSISDKDGRIGPGTLAYLKTAILAANEDEIDAEWAANLEDRRRVLNQLASVGSIYAAKITDDTIYDDRERALVLDFQYLSLQKDPSKLIVLNGILSGQTRQEIMP